MHDGWSHYIEEIIDVRESQDSFEFYIKWLGFGTEHNTWEPALTIAEDVPTLCKRYVSSLSSFWKTKLAKILPF